MKNISLMKDTFASIVSNDPVARLARAEISAARVDALVLAQSGPF